MVEREGVRFDVPPIPSLIFRPLRGESDYAGLVVMREGVREADQLAPASPYDAIPTTDELAQRFTAEDIGGPRVLVVEIDGAIVGYNQILHSPDEGGVDTLFHRGWLLPAWRGRGIGRAMLRSAEDRLRAIAFGRPSPRPAVFATMALSAERETVALLQEEGYRPAWRIVDMTRDTTTATDGAPLPAGLTVRAIRPEHYRAIYLAARDAWQGLPFATEDYPAYLADTMETPGFDTALCRVAWAGDEVAGLVLCRRNEDEVFILDVAVRKAWQRQGIACALLAGCLHALAAEGIKTARLYVDAESVGARRLYEGIGFRAVKEHACYQKPCAPTP